MRHCKQCREVKRRARFRKFMGRYVSALRAKGLRYMNPTLLRKCMTSAEYCVIQYPEIQAKVWQGLADNMLTMCANKRKSLQADVTMMIEGRNTR